MLALPDAQACLMSAVLGQRGGAAAAAELLREQPPLTVLQRLQVYRHNHLGSLGAALADVFPVVERLVGAAFFGQAAAAYIAAHPSRSGNLHDFGAEMAAFLRVYAPAAGLPYLPDVAALEWACHRAYHEAEFAPLAPTRLAEVAAADQPRLRLQLQPSARFVASRFPVLAIWLANQPQRADAGRTVSLDEGGVDLLVVQRALEVEFRHLGRGEGRWLRALASGADLADATDAALDAEPRFDLGATLARHVGDGLFVDLATPSRRRGTR